MTLNPQQFAALCYLILMDHHGAGFFEAHPNYIEEKLVMLGANYDAYCYLDRNNQEKVKNYHEFWKFELPEPIKKYEDDLLICGKALEEFEA